MRVSLLIAAALAATACSTTSLIEERQVASTGFVGCAPRDIEITAGERYTWTATCKGRVFHCSAAPQMACKAAGG